MFFFFCSLSHITSVVLLFFIWQVTFPISFLFIYISTNVKYTFLYYMQDAYSINDQPYYSYSTQTCWYDKKKLQNYLIFLNDLFKPRNQHDPFWFLSLTLLHCWNVWNIFLHAFLSYLLQQRAIYFNFLLLLVLFVFI